MPRTEATLNRFPIGIHRGYFSVWWRRQYLAEVKPQQVAQLAAVPDREILIAVVHQDVGLPRLFAERLDPRDPFLELFLRVVVSETGARRVTLRLPCLAVAAVEPDHRQVFRGRRGDRRDARVETLRHVNADVGQVALLEEAERLLDVPLFHPALVTELDGHTEVRQPRDALFDVRLGLLRDHEPLRELEQYGPHLARRMQRHEGVTETLPDLVDDLVGELLTVDVALALGDRGLQVLIERVRARRVVHQERVGLDVEREVLRRALDPKDRVVLRRGEVVRRV